MPNSPKIVLKGSERKPMPDARRIAPSDPNQQMEVSVIVRRRNPLKLGEVGTNIMSHDEFAKTYGADPADIERVHQFAAQHGLRVVPQNDEIARRTVKLSGTVADLQNAFSVQLHEYDCPQGKYRGREGAIQIPQDYAGIIEAVLGLDNRPQAKAHFRLLNRNTQAVASAASVSYTPVQVAQLYNFPTDANGSGQTIAIIELGGGYSASDIQSYFQQLGIAPPKVTSVSVDGGKNQPTNPNSADAEVLLDIEVSGAVAPAANIVVYFAPNTDQGFLDALTQAIHDTANNPCVVSISWGGSENSWTPQAITAFDDAAQSAAALGVSITAACGDNGSSDGSSDGSNQVDFPSSSPHILACGGTTLQSSNGKITSETVWNDGAQGGATGGGFSTAFPLPTWQNIRKQSGRGVPDVAGDADPNTGYNVLVDGQQAVIGGTSAVAPLWAGLIALLNQRLGSRVGFLNPNLYSLTAASKAFHDITSGNNGSYKAAPGWDPTTGLGTPDGANLAAALSKPAS